MADRTTKRPTKDQDKNQTRQVPGAQKQGRDAGKDPKPGKRREEEEKKRRDDELDEEMDEDWEEKKEEARNRSSGRGRPSPP
ncbi:MAG: hypothetical protein ACODAB_08455 [Gemmatimonadota bacterium]